MPLLSGVIASQISGRLFAPSGAFDSIATASGTGSSGIINFTSIPATYTHLQVRIMCISSFSDQPIMQVGNGSIDTGSNYARHSFNGNGTNAAGHGSSYTQFNIYGYRVGGSTSVPTVGIVDILDYANTSKNKTFKILSGCDKNGTGEIDFNSGLWMNTAAITNIRIFSESGSNWSTTSHFALYGIKGA
jgi:hypothetical protein